MFTGNIALFYEGKTIFAKKVLDISAQQPFNFAVSSTYSLFYVSLQASCLNQQVQHRDTLLVWRRPLYTLVCCENELGQYNCQTLWAASWFCAFRFATDNSSKWGSGVENKTGFTGAQSRYIDVSSVRIVVRSWHASTLIAFVLWCSTVHTL